MLSILCIAFNHERYIRECLDAMLAQETTFAVEIVVHDDASTDATPAIVREYAERHPRVIRPIFQVENQRSRFGPILPRLIAEVRGEFFAVCEGDDYWTEPRKLQEQVALLIADPALRMVSHEIRAISVDGAELPRWCLLREGERAEYTDRDVLTGVFNHPNTWVARTPALSAEFLEFVRTLPMGDDPLNLHLLRDGGRGLSLGETWSVYRQHSGGVWSTLGAFRRRLQELALYLGHRRFYGALYRSAYDRLIASHRRELARLILSDLAHFRFAAVSANIDYLRKFRSPALRPARELMGLAGAGAITIVTHGPRAVARRLPRWTTAPAARPTAS